MPRSHERTAGQSLSIGLRETLRGQWRSLTSVGIVVLATFAANALFLLKIRSNNPILYHSGLGSSEQGWVKGAYTIDPNDGWTAQALGRRAAETWADGHVPLWNLYEGLGQPLAGEMQSAALFLPFVLFQLLPNGIFLMHLALELVAGLSTLGLLRTLRLGWSASTVGAVVFALNGSFSVMTNAPFNPIAFLPMTVLGIELIRRECLQRRRPAVGLIVTALALAFSLFAGFPETAFLQGVFACCWTVVRVVGIDKTKRLSFLGWTAAGGVSGILLALPILVAFKDFMEFGTTAYHEGVANNMSYPLKQITTLALPYGKGPLANDVFGLQAGYITLPAVLLAIIGMFSRRFCGIRILLAGILFVLITNMFGFTPVKVVLNHIPGLGMVLGYKYGLALIEFAVAILAAVGVDELARRAVSRRTVVIAGLSVALYAAGSLAYLHGEGFLNNRRWTLVTVGGVAIAVVLVCAISFIRWKPSSTSILVATAVAGGVLIIDAGMHYAVPQLAASPPRAVDMAPVRFLQDNLGTSRFYTLGPIQPNYGSYWGIQQMNANDLPVAKKYSDLLVNELTPAPGSTLAKATRKSFRSFQLVPFNPSAKAQKHLLLAYADTQPVFRRAGVKYLVTAPGVVDQRSANKLELEKVLSSPKTEIWLDGKAAPNFSAPGCQVTHESLTGATFRCKRPSTLTRLQLASPGWTAQIGKDNHAVSVNDDQLFQTLELPAGTSKVEFSYEPKHFKLATAASLLTLILLVANVVLNRRVRRPGRGSSSWSEKTI